MTFSLTPATPGSSSSHLFQPLLSRWKSSNEFKRWDIYETKLTAHYLQPNPLNAGECLSSASDCTQQFFQIRYLKIMTQWQQKMEKADFFVLISISETRKETFIGVLDMYKYEFMKR